jgi:hypothetical protein
MRFTASTTALGLSLIACGSSAGSEPPPPNAPEAPLARSAHAMVYDEARGVTLLFGGSGSALFGDTWTWNGTRWTRVATTGPSPRNVPSLAYDARRQRVVLFGGQSGTMLLADTWEWDGTTWTQRATTGPEPRIHQGAGYDRRRERVVMYGGATATDAILRDTWEWDGSSWVRAASDGPDRWVNGIVYDPARQELLLHALDRVQNPGRLYRTELYSWTGSAWTPASAPFSGPAVSPTQAIAALSGGGILLFDGGTLQGAASTWRWSGSAWTQIQEPGPSLRSGHAMAFDTARNRVVMFGGFVTGTDLADTWEWTGQSWAEVNK